MKLGLYRDEATQPTAVLYHDGMVQATTLAEAQPAGPPPDAGIPDATPPPDGAAPPGSDAGPGPDLGPRSDAGAPTVVPRGTAGTPPPEGPVPTPRAPRRARRRRHRLRLPPAAATSVPPFLLPFALLLTSARRGRRRWR